MVQLYRFQEIVNRKMQRALKKEGRGLMVMASGTGKTLTSAQIMKTLLNGTDRGLFLCHNNEILGHARAEYRKMFGKKERFGMLSGEEKILDERILFASLQSMRTWKEFFNPQTFRFVMVDESHHSQADTYKDVICYFKPKYLMAMTATPNRMDKREIREIFGTEVVNLTLAEAIAKQYVASVTYNLMTVGSLSRDNLKTIFREVMEEGMRISLKQLNETLFIEHRDEAIVEEILAHKGQGIVFCENILHTEKFQSFLPGSVVFHSKKAKRHNQHALKGFKSGSVRYLLTVDKFNEGVDIPDADNVIFLRCTDSRTIFLQQLGRGLRRTLRKRRINVLDFVGNVERLEHVKQLADRIKEYAPEGPKDLDVFTASGEGFDFGITQEVLDIFQVLERIQIPLYKTCGEASIAAQKLKIKTKEEYKRHYREDPRLPSHPNEFYASEWKNWPEFLGTMTTAHVKDPYPTLTEASIAAQKLKIKTSEEYSSRYRKDPRLPAAPNRFYASEWKNWPEFLGTMTTVHVKDPYPTLAEASIAAQKLKIKTRKEYNRRYRKDPRLPAAPNQFYASEWRNWPEFLGRMRKARVKNPYPTLAEASAAAQKLKIKTKEEYRRCYPEDPRLPAAPDRFYASEWKSWPEFLGTIMVRVKDHYPTLAEASAAAQKLKIKTSEEYSRRYRKDPRLPSNPHRFYASEWKSWPEFLGRRRK